MTTPPIRTYDIELPHNSLCIMGAGTQEKFKHTIPPARSIDVFKLKNGDKVETHIERINVSFSLDESPLPFSLGVIPSSSSDDCETDGLPYFACLDHIQIL